MQNPYFHCYPLIQPTFTQYAVLVILPEPPMTGWKLFPYPIKDYVYPTYEHASAPRSPINYLVARSWWGRDNVVEHAEQVLMRRIQGLFQSWTINFRRDNGKCTILLYTRKSPCQACAEKIKYYKREFFPRQEFVVAYSKLLSSKDANNILQGLKDTTGIRVVQVPEISGIRDKQRCIDVLKHANVNYSHLLPRSKSHYKSHRF